jgi:hypothetical protein
VGPDIQAKNGLSMFLDLNLKLKLLWSPVIQVPNELLEQAKAAAQAALEEMDAD